MSKIGPNKSTSRFLVRLEPGTDVLVIKDKRTGKISTLRGYGALRGDYVVRKGIDLTKPIAPQVADKMARTRNRPSQRKRRKG
jgi:hypothetical protein